MKSSLKDKRILLTYGPTWVAIDHMRVISNRSSGQVGRLIAEGLIQAGAKVTILEGPVTVPLKNPRARIKKFVYFDDFKKLFLTELKKHHQIVIHAAAVSDFAPVSRHRTKIASDQPLKLTCLPTPKLIKKVRSLSPKSLLVGFKLESVSSERALKSRAMKSVKTNACDLVVANSLTGGYTGFIFDRNGSRLGSGKSRKAIAHRLISVLQKRIHP